MMKLKFLKALRETGSISFNQKREEAVFLEEERQAMIFLLAFAQFEELSVYYFQDFLFVSKNTILKDLKKLRAVLSERG